MPIKDLFIRRKEKIEGKSKEYYSKKINQTVRHKIIGYILDCNLEIKGGFGGTIPSYNEIKDFCVKLEREFGRTICSTYGYHSEFQEFLFNCSDDEFLSSLEILFKLKYKNITKMKGYAHFNLADRLVSLFKVINDVFEIDKVGYKIIMVDIQGLPFMVVPIDSQYLHSEAIQKPLTLMHNADFKGALDEFEKALDDYRNKKYGDAIHKAVKAYESTLKTILTLKSIPFDPKRDKIPDLVEKIRNNSNIIISSLNSAFDSFWSVLKNGPPTLRNMPGSGHGQGNQVTNFEKSYADYVLRFTGVYIAFLIERYNETK